MIIRPRRNQEVHNIITQWKTLNKGEIVREVGKPCTLIGVSHMGKVMCPMQRMRKTRNVRLTNWRISYIVHGEGDHHLDLSLLLRIQRMSHTGNDPELHQVKISPATRNIVAIGVRAKVHRTRALETRPWMKHWAKSLNRLSHDRLRVQAFLGDSISRLSLFIMVGQIRWSMLAILIKKLPFILGMRPNVQDLSIQLRSNGDEMV